MLSNLGATEFDFIRELVLTQSGVVLESDKRYLVETRLLPLAKREGFNSLDMLVTKLRSEPRNGLHWKVVEAMVTHETSFFRDLHPFEILRRQILPVLLDKRSTQKSLNIWCAAASSGQEPYSFVMLMRENFPQLADWTVRFIASDLSSAILERAQEGRYTQMEVNRGLPANYLIKYFVKDRLGWQVKEEIRRLIEFRTVNLCEPFPCLPLMDIIFMRNVLIYFSKETKQAIMAKVRQLLRPDGFFFLGGAETTFGLDDEFERVQFDRAACYKLRSVKPL